MENISEILLCLGSCLALVVCVVAPSSTKRCAHLDFPNLDSAVLTAQENSTVTFPFKLETSDCPDFESVTITVSKKHKQTQLPGDYCTIQASQDGCDSSGKGCKCTGETGTYLFTKTVDRNDGTEWIWWTSHELSNEKKITFNVTFAAEIARLTFESDHLLAPNLVERDRPAVVVCSFVNGNPPVTARLLDRHGVEMEGSMYSSGQIRYRFPAVGCQDAGLIRCEAPGASHNETATLLVKCPPTFETDLPTELNITSGNDAEFKLPVTTHTTKIQKCLLTKAPFTDADEVTTMMSWGLTGTPPDLTLTVRLDNVRKAEEGQWRLELTNDAGTGYKVFTLHVTDSEKPVNNSTDLNDTSSTYITDVWHPDNATTHPAVTEPGSAHSERTITLLSNSAAFVVVIIIVIVTIVCIRKGKRRNVETAQAIPMISVNVPRQSPRSSTHSRPESESFYHEIDDSRQEEPTNDNETRHLTEATAQAAESESCVTMHCADPRTRAAQLKGTQVASSSRQGAEALPDLYLTPTGATAARVSQKRAGSRELGDTQGSLYQNFESKAGKRKVKGKRHCKQSE